MLVYLDAERPKSKRMKVSEREPCRTPSDVYDLFKKIADLEQEVFCVVTLDSKNRAINTHMISMGLLNASLVHPREVFRTAIKDNSASIILAHNHPSGDSSPSREDLRLTKQLIEAGNIVDIKILDHVIIAQENNLSMRENGLCVFQ